MSRAMTILMVAAILIALALSFTYHSGAWTTVSWAYFSVYFIGWIADKIEEEEF